MVITIMATSEPGTFFDTLGVRAIITMLNTPIAVVTQSTVSKF